MLLAQGPACVPVDGGDGAGEADWAGTAAGGGGVLQPAGELRQGGATQSLGVTAGREAGAEWASGVDTVFSSRGGRDGRRTPSAVDVGPLVVFVVSPGTAERAADAGGRVRGGATPGNLLRGANAVRHIGARPKKATSGGRWALLVVVCELCIVVPDPAFNARAAVRVPPEVSGIVHATLVDTEKRLGLPRSYHGG